MWIICKGWVAGLREEKSWCKNISWSQSQCHRSKITVKSLPQWQQLISHPDTIRTRSHCRRFCRGYRRLGCKKNVWHILHVSATQQYTHAIFNAHAVQYTSTCGSRRPSRCRGCSCAGRWRSSLGCKKMFACVRKFLNSKANVPSVKKMKSTCKSLYGTHQYANLYASTERKH